MPSHRDKCEMLLDLKDKESQLSDQVEKGKRAGVEREGKGITVDKELRVLVQKQAS